VTPLEQPEWIRGLLLVSFDETRNVAVPPPASLPPEASPKEEQPAARRRGRLGELEEELRRMKDRDRTTQEESETTEEEFKATTEELQSTNEELQSTNEELETSKEEMQSLNEELTTVNAQFQARVDDLSVAYNDMQDLLNSTDIATIFLDVELKIERFTNKACQLISIRNSDLGRPLSELSTELQNADLSERCQHVLATLEIFEQEVRDGEGAWYLMRIAPYRTSENKIEVVVLTFVNIQRLKQAETLSRLRVFFERIVETIRQPLLVLDNQLTVVLANPCFGDTFRVDPKQLIGQSLTSLGEGAWDIPELRMLLEETLPLNRSFEDFEIAKEFPRVGYRRFQLNGRRIEREAGMPDGILLALEDVTDQAGS
jgi:two-component system CheB/CheR fusion protein